MAKFEKSVTINLGNYESMRIGVTEANSFEECDIELKKHLSGLDIDIDKPIGKALDMQNNL
jgi:ribosomal protein L5